MSIEATVARVEAIRQALANPALLLSSSAARSGGVEAPPSEEGASAESAPSAPASGSFASALARASGTQAPAGAGAVPAAQLLPAGASTEAAGGLAGVTGAYGPGPTASGASSRIVAIATSQLGQTEQPPGSNESPAIATYRSATAGAMPGAPWCAYFASWVAREAGEPIGASGEGLGSAGEIWSWAQSTGRAVANGPGVVPKPGDLIVFGNEHVGIVRAVLPGGQIQTIEGNYENKVAANVRSPSEATGYVEMG